MTLDLALVEAFRAQFCVVEGHVHGRSAEEMLRCAMAVLARVESRPDGLVVAAA